jgi:hypothetical protein
MRVLVSLLISMGVLSACKYVLPTLGEVPSNFAVRFERGGRPLQGVEIQEVSQIAGPISDSNRWRTPNLPIPAVELHLLDVSTGDRVSSTRSGNDGLFAFSNASAGEYLLVAEAGQGPSGIAFDESRILVRLLPFAAKQQISLRLMNSTCGAHLYSQ